jgi:hypothetical protein
LPHEDVKPAYGSKLFAAWRLCEKKKIACEKSKKEWRAKTRRRKEKISLRLCGFAALREEKKLPRRPEY